MNYECNFNDPRYVSNKNWLQNFVIPGFVRSTRRFHNTEKIVDTKAKWLSLLFLFVATYTSSSLHVEKKKKKNKTIIDCICLSYFKHLFINSFLNSLCIFFILTYTYTNRKTKSNEVNICFYSWFPRWTFRENC